MRRISVMLAAVVAIMPFSSLAQQAGPYKVLQTAKVGGEGGFDYVYADDAARKLYVPRLGPAGQINVFDLDTLKPAGESPTPVRTEWRSMRSRSMGSAAASRW